MDSVLREMRERLGITLDVVAKQLHISPGYLHQIETGHRSITTKRADAFVQLYNVKFDDLFVPVRFMVKSQEQIDSQIEM